MECPGCHKKSRIEIDLHPDGYAKNLQECGDCGALWILDGNLEVLLPNSTKADTHEVISSTPTNLYLNKSPDFLFRMQRQLR